MLDHEKVLFREWTLEASKFIGSRFFGPGMRIVTELTVLEPRGHAYGCSRSKVTISLEPGTQAYWVRG